MGRLTRHVLGVATLAVVGWGLPWGVQAQRLHSEASFGVASGLSIGNGGAESAAIRRAPLFVDVGWRGSLDEAPSLGWGGALRVELEGAPGVGIVPRIDAERRFGPLLVRPALGIPFFFAPHSLLGAEGSVSVHLPWQDGIAFFGSALLDVFFWGSDLPENSTIVMLNLMLGASLALP